MDNSVDSSPCQEIMIKVSHFTLWQERGEQQNQGENWVKATSEKKPHAGACTSTEKGTGQRICVHAKRWGRRTWAQGYSGIVATARRLFRSNPRVRQSDFCCGMRDKHKRQEKRSEAVLVLQLLVCILTTGRPWCRILFHEVVRRVRRFKKIGQSSKYI